MLGTSLRQSERSFASPKPAADAPMISRASRLIVRSLRPVVGRAILPQLRLRSGNKGRRGKPQAVAHLGGLEPICDVKFAEDIRDVDAGRLVADEELLSDLAVRASLSEKGEDLALARREAQLGAD